MNDSYGSTPPVEAALAVGRLSLLEVIEKSGGDVKSLKTHAANLIANDEDGSLDSEHEQMAQVVAGALNGPVAVALSKFLADELLEAAKPEAESIKSARKEALEKEALKKV